MNYLLSASLATAVFYALYALAFRGLRFHALNRGYLLAALGASLLIPLMELPAPTTPTLPKVALTPVPLTPTSQVLAPAATMLPQPVRKFVVNWALVGWAVYLVGAVAMALRLGKGLWRLARMARQAGRWEGGLKLIPTRGPNASFFNLIFLNETGLSPSEREQVLAHEAEHARLGHSADRLLLEALRVAFWFNPVLWLYQRSLAHLHELQVDERVARRFEARGYAKLLLRLHGGTALPLANLFSRQPLKDRLAALFQPKPSSAMKKLLYLAAAPVALAATLALAQRVPPSLPSDGMAPAAPSETPLSAQIGWKPWGNGNASVLDKAGARLLVAKKVNMFRLDVHTAYLSQAKVNEYGQELQKLGFEAKILNVKRAAGGQPEQVTAYLRNTKSGKEITVTHDLKPFWSKKRQKQYGVIGVSFSAADGEPQIGKMVNALTMPHLTTSSPAANSERQGKVSLRAPVRVAFEEMPIPTEETAGHLDLKNGRATMYLNLNRYNPEFIETAKRFFQSNDVELRVTDEQIDAFGRFSSGKIELVQKSGGSATIRAAEEYTKRDGSRWVYLVVHQQSGQVGAGSLLKEFLPTKNALQMYLPKVGFLKNDEGC